MSRNTRIRKVMIWVCPLLAAGLPAFSIGPATPQTDKPVKTMEEALPGKTATAPVQMVASRTSSVMSSQKMASYGRLPLAFERNQGQTNKQALFLSHGLGYSLFLTPTEAVLSLQQIRQEPVASNKSGLPPGMSMKGIAGKRPAVAQSQMTTSVLRMKLTGANPHPQVMGLEVLPGSVNYFIGKDPSKWRTNVASYGKVRYKNVYQGIDLVYYGNQRQLEYDWVVAPGAEVHKIAIEIKGAQKAMLTANGDLKLQTAGGDVTQHAPVVYQEIDGKRKPISARIALETTRSAFEA